MPKQYPSEFRRKVLDLLAGVRRVAQVAADLDFSDQTIYTWQRQELIDTGQLPGTPEGRLDRGAGPRSAPAAADRRPAPVRFDRHRGMGSRARQIRQVRAGGTF